MHLAEEYFLGRTVLCLPLPHPSLQRALVQFPVRAGALALQPLAHRLGLQCRLLLEQFLDTRPDVGERIGSRSPVVRSACFAGQLLQLAVLPCRLAIHAGLHRCPLQRCSLIEVAANFLDLGIRDLASCSHW